MLHTFSRTPLFWSFVVLLSLSGCGNLVQEVSVDKIPAAQLKLVVQGFISPQDTVLAVYVDRPTSVLGLYTDAESPSRRYPVDNAIVDISDGTRTVRLSKRNGLVPPATVSYELYYGVSTRDFPVVAGRTYTLSASAVGFPSVSAQCTVPTAVQPTDIRLDSTNQTSAGQQRRTYTSQLQWQDPAGARNYYRVTGQALLMYRSRTGTSATARDTTVYQTRSLSFDGDNNVSDLNRDGQRLTLNASLTLYGTTEQPQQFAMTLGNLDEGLYLFLEAVRNQRRQGSNPFSEPILIPSNIQNGLGYFGAFNQTTLTIKAKE